MAKREITKIFPEIICDICKKPFIFGDTMYFFRMANIYLDVCLEDHNKIVDFLNSIKKEA